MYPLKKKGRPGEKFLGHFFFFFFPLEMLSGNPAKEIFFSAEEIILSAENFFF
jgi:hypothetical protein